MPEYNLFIKHVGLIGVVRLIPSLRGLILLPVLAKEFGTQGYGTWSLIFAGISLMLPFVMLGLPSAMIRFLSSKKDKKEFAKDFFTIFFTILVISSFISLLIFFSSDYLAKVLFKEAAVVPIIKIASVLIMLEALKQTSLESFRTFGKIRWYSGLTSIEAFAEVGLILLFVLSGFGLMGAVTALLIVRGSILMISILFIVLNCGFSLPDFSVLRPYLSFGIPLVPAVIFEVIVISSDRYVIGFFLGSSKVGIYSAAYGIGAIAAAFIGPITYILSPTIFKLFDENKIDEVKTYLSYSLKYYLMFCIPSVFGLSILSKSLLYSLTTPEFVTLGIFIAPLVAMSMVFEGVRAIFGEVLMLFKRTKIFGIASIVAGIVNLFLNILLIPHYGIIVAAITTLISYIILGFIMFYSSRKYMKFNINLRFIIKSIISSFVMVLTIWTINPIELKWIAFSIGIGAIVYFCVLFILKGFSKEELGLLKKIIGLKRTHERLR